MIFADTGAFVARYRKSDDWHRAAIEGWGALRRRDEEVFTSSLVIAEAAQVLGRSADPQWVADRVTMWLNSPSLRILRGDMDADMEATGLMRKYADQAIGFVDCVSFALMRRQGIRRAFAFDRHFVMAGFELWPGMKRK